MLAYAPRPDTTRLRPATLGLIVFGHAGLLFLVMTAKSEQLFKDPVPPTTVILIPEPTPPPPPDDQVETKPSVSQITIVEPIVPPLPSPGPTVPLDPQPLPPLGPVAGTGALPQPIPFRVSPPSVTRSARLTRSRSARAATRRACASA